MPMHIAHCSKKYNLLDTMSENKSKQSANKASGRPQNKRPLETEVETETEIETEVETEMNTRIIFGEEEMVERHSIQCMPV